MDNISFNPFGIGSRTVFPSILIGPDENRTGKANPADDRVSSNTDPARTPSRVLQGEMSDALRVLQEKYGIDPAQLELVQGEPEAVAGRILGFVRDALNQFQQRNPSEQETKSLLAEIQQGIDQGFKEAREVLQNLGVLDDKLSRQIDGTEKLVRQGLSRTDAPEEAEPRITTQQTRSVQFDSSRSASLEIQTADGDTVTIHFSSSFTASLDAARTNDGGQTVSQLSQSLSANTQTGIRIEGNLDEKERKAIDKLVNRVDKLAGKFFDGDFHEAFSKAAKLGFDEKQLSGFSLSLDMTRSVRATGAYQEIATSETGEHSAEVSQAAGFVREIAAPIQEHGDEMKKHFKRPEKAFGEIFSALLDHKASRGGFRLDPKPHHLLRNVVSELFQRLASEPVAQPTPNPAKQSSA